MGNLLGAHAVVCGKAKQILKVSGEPVGVIGGRVANVQNALPSVVAEMIPLRMTKSPKCSPSRRSCAYDLIIGRRMLIISCSSTDSR